MAVQGFRSFFEADEYARQLSAQQELAPLLAGARTFVISTANRALIGLAKSLAQYEAFFAEHLSKIPSATEQLLNTQTSTTIDDGGILPRHISPILQQDDLPLEEGDDDYPFDDDEEYPLGDDEYPLEDDEYPIIIDDETTDTDGF